MTLEFQDETLHDWVVWCLGISKAGAVVLWKLDPRVVWPRAFAVRW